MRKVLSLLIAGVMTLGLAVVVAAPAQAADRRKCVTNGELAKLYPGKSAKSTIKLLDGRGKKVNKKTRKYKTCDGKVPVYIKYNKKFKKSKKVKIKYIKTAYTPPQAPGAPGVQPPPPPVVVPPPAPPAPPAPPVVKTAPGAPDVSFEGSTEDSITVSWLPGSDGNASITNYRVGWITGPEHPEAPWTSTDLAASTRTYTFTGLDADTMYWTWVQAKNEVGYGEKQWFSIKTKQGMVMPPVDPPTDPTIEERWVEVPNCPMLTVDMYHQKRVLPDGEWVTHHKESRQAKVADCVNVVETLPSNVMLPDLRIKNLDKCGKGDLDLTGGDCFMIVPSEGYISDYPHLEGRKLLKFPVLTFNTGEGVLEVVADRTGVEAKDWKAYQNFLTTDGKRVSRPTPKVEFYFAGDGHDHWHFRDFDYYWIENANGEEVGTAEKHGYCVYDNTSYTPFKGLPNVPDTEVYPYATTCGQGLPSTLTMIQGLSKGWGDTYPASLPDQALDITGLPDGVYTVGVHADALGAIDESDETNNVATIQVRITGDEVEVLAGTATGGLA